MTALLHSLLRLLLVATACAWPAASIEGTTEPGEIASVKRKTTPSSLNQREVNLCPPGMLETIPAWKHTWQALDSSRLN